MSALPLTSARLSRLSKLFILCVNDLLDGDFTHICMAFFVCRFFIAVCVQKATISGVTNGSTVDESKIITCVADADAYPQAQYTWRNDVDGSASNGSQFILQPGTEYRITCTASNNFDRQGCYAAAYVVFNSKFLPCFLSILDCVC